MTTTTIKPGDVWCSTWGHEQTNVDFYEVTRVTKTTITLQQLECLILDNPATMTGITKPMRGAYTSDKPVRRKVKVYNDEPYVSLGNYAGAPIARPYDDRPMHYSTYA